MRLNNKSIFQNCNPLPADSQTHPTHLLLCYNFAMKLIKLTKISGFTLAEILITLLVIGVIAAITIPTLINNVEDRELVSSLKKYYSTISNAILQWENENNCIGNIESCISKYAMVDCKNSFSGIESKLKIVDRRYQTNTNFSTIDWLPTSTTFINGTAQVANWQGVSKMAVQSDVSCQYLFAGGATMTVVLPDSSMRSGFLFIDVNGKKPPNRVGKDTFPIGLGSYNNPKYKDVNPYFNEDNNSYAGILCNITNGTACTPDDGKSPTAYVLMHNKLPDLKAIYGQ